MQFDRKDIRGIFATNVMQKPAPDAVIPAQSLFADAVFYKPFTVTSLADSGAGFDRLWRFRLARLDGVRQSDASRAIIRAREWRSA
ncbi:MAG TPA: hypothetical protein VKU62_12090 [Thermoanaerobaculia bacterium]|nr:hypothetical protein [Thermoanaerobaculia bacterium]